MKALKLLTMFLLLPVVPLCAQELPVFFDQPPAPDLPMDAELAARLKAIEQEVELLKSRPIPESKPAPTPDPLGMSAKWNHGLELQSQDKAFKIHVGGRTQIDSVFFQNDNSFANTGGATDQDAVNVRRGRLRVDGTIYEIIDFAAEYDFVNEFNVNPGTPAVEGNHAAVPAVTDLWVNFKEAPVVGNIKIGSFKDPIGMEHLTSSRYLEFLERSPIQDTFTGSFNNGFTPGIMFWNTFDEEHGTWATGVFKNNTNIFTNGFGDGEYNWTSRVTYLPIYLDEGKTLLHVGLSGSIRDPNNNSLRHRSRPSLRNGAPSGLNPTFIDTTSFGTSQQDMLEAI